MTGTAPERPRRLQTYAKRHRASTAPVQSVGLPLLGLLVLLPALAAVPPVETVLANMDSAAAGWRGMRANVQWTRYRSLVDEKTVESGRIVVRRAESGSFEMLQEFTEPNRYFYLVRGAHVEIYKPRIKEVQVYDVGKSRDQLENALLIGFGVSGAYLREHYEVAVEGEEEIAGHQAVKLALRPRNPGGRLNNRKLDMWISTEHWQPVQQRVYERNPKDYRIFSYSEVEINPRFAGSEFKLRLERGTRRTRPQR